MVVSVIFDKDFRGELSGAVWLLDTPENRIQFEKSNDLDPNSALFSGSDFSNSRYELAQLFGSIHDHYPDLEGIAVVGIKLNTLIASELWDDYVVEEREDGFICYPANSN